MKLTGRALHLSEGIFELKGCPGPGLCIVKGCRNKVGRRKGCLCNRHYQHRWRLRTPKKSAYATLRDHAKVRKIPFTISYDYFLGMIDCLTSWDLEAESRGETLTIDRKDASKGYVPGNLQVLTYSENTIKGNRERHLPANVQAIIARKRLKAKEAWAMVEPEDPF